MASDDDWVHVTVEENGSDDGSYYSFYADGAATDDNEACSNVSWTEVNDDDGSEEVDRVAGKDASDEDGDNGVIDTTAESAPKVAPAAAVPDIKADGDCYGYGSYSYDYYGDDHGYGYGYSYGGDYSHALAYGYGYGYARQQYLPQSYPSVYRPAASYFYVQDYGTMYETGYGILLAAGFRLRRP